MVYNIETYNNPQKGTTMEPMGPLTPRLPFSKDPENDVQGLGFRVNLRGLGFGV